MVIFFCPATFLESFISFQVPSFAWRSNVLSDLRHVSQDNGINVRTPVAQQYHLDSRRHHPYQSLDGDLINGKNEKKQYYQLNSKKHHQYQPDPKLYQQEQPQEPESVHHSELEKVLNGGTEESKLGKESTKPENGVNSKLKIVKNKNKNGRIVIVMSKYMENGKQPGEEMKQTETSENCVNGAVEKPFLKDDRNGQDHHAGAEEFQKVDTSQLTKNSGPDSSENSIHKRRHSEPSGERGDAKSFLSCRSISAPNPSSSEDQINSTSLNGHHSSASCQDEPMDLSFTGSRGARNDVTDCGSNGRSNLAEKEDAASTQEPERASNFTPFLGNIIITDVTANCLTVTFKEYVPV